MKFHSKYFFIFLVLVAFIVPLNLSFTADPTKDKPFLILEIIHGATFTTKESKFRVWNDGRYENFSDYEFGVNSSDQFQITKKPLEWRLVYQFTSEEMQKLLELINQTDFASLKETYDGQTMDAGTDIWRVFYKGKVKQITLKGVAKLQVIDDFFMAFQKIHKWNTKKEETIWEVFKGTQKWSVKTPCQNLEYQDLGLIEILRYLYNSDPLTYTPKNGKPIQPRETEPWLIKLTYKANGQMTTERILYQNGDSVKKENGKTLLTRTLNKKGLREVVDILDKTDFSKWPTACRP